MKFILHTKNGIEIFPIIFSSRGDKMKKSSVVAGSMMLMALTGYGAWCMYKKMNPHCAHELKKDMKRMTRNMEKSMEDMM